MSKVCPFEVLDECKERGLDSVQSAIVMNRIYHSSSKTIQVRQYPEKLERCIKKVMQQENKRTGKNFTEDEATAVCKKSVE